MKATDNFFEKKHSWSLLKDEILASYLKPYLAKVSKAGTKIIIADCFAGKGRFDDGEPGSPILIASSIEEAKLRSPEVEIEGVFIEKKYFDELKNNLSDFNYCKLLEGSYRERVETFRHFLRDKKKSLFLYVDPYGIKSLDFSIFKEIDQLGLSSFELLINFNSFGFLREGCRLLCLSDMEFIDESDFYEVEGPNSVERMNAIAGGSYWQDILNEYKTARINMYTSERLFSAQYNRELNKVFQYVVNIPIKRKTSHLPKYRIFFGTNHPDGLLLMANSMNRRWRNFVDQERSGQTILMEEFDFPDMVKFEDYCLHDDILLFADRSILLKDLLIKLIEKYGITYSESRYKEECKKMEKEGIIEIQRKPDKTPTGLKATSMDFKKYEIWVHKKRTQ